MRLLRQRCRSRHSGQNAIYKEACRDQWFEDLTSDSSADELSGATFTKIVNSTDAFRKVASDLGGIHFGSSGTLTVAQCGVKTLPIGMSLDRLVVPYQLPIVAPADCSAQKHNQLNPDLLKNGYPLLRKLSVIVVADGNTRQQAGEAYAKMLLVTQGQTLMRQAGYLSLK